MNRKYILAAVAFMVGGGILAAILISVLLPNQDNALVIAATFGFITTTTASVLAFMKSQETHLSVNSRLDAFIANAESAAKASGIEQGRKEANARTDKLKETR